MAVRGGCMLVVKCLLFFFNFVLWCAGGTILGFALWLRFNEDLLKQFPDETASQTYYTGTYILMAAGGAIMIVGFFGCCGAIRENICQLSTYFVIVFIIFGLEIAAGVWCYLEREQIGNTVGKYLTTSVTEKYTVDAATKAAVDFTQQKLKCCGADGPEDYMKSDQLIPPESCWTNCTKCGETDEYQLFEVGCKSKIVEVLRQNLYIIGVACTAIALVEVMAMILTILLCRAIRREIEDEEDEKHYNA